MKSIAQTIFIIAVTSTTCIAEELVAPAVSSVNGKLDYLGGWMESEEGHNVGGSISVPLGTRFGFQADGLYTHVSDRDFFSGAGHLFWRDPNIGLLGIVGGGIYSEDVLDGYQAGVEGEYYFDRFTIRTLAGIGNISYDTPVPFINTNPTKFTGSVFVDWYAMDNLRIGAGYSYLFENHLGQVQAEYQSPWKGLAFTAEYARGENNYDHALFGVRFYFGKDKSLKDRHRQDDPPSLAQHILTGVGLYGAEFNRKAKRYDEERRQALINSLKNADNAGANGNSGNYYYPVFYNGTVHYGEFTPVYHNGTVHYEEITPIYYNGSVYYGDTGAGSSGSYGSASIIRIPIGSWGGLPIYTPPPIPPIDGSPVGWGDRTRSGTHR